MKLPTLVSNPIARGGVLGPRRALLLRTVAVLVAVTLGAPAFAESGPAFSVAADGEWMRIQNGSYGELFPGGDRLADDARVLALDRLVGETSERLLVPGTESMWAESSARLIVDERAGVNYLLWESRINGVHPLLKLVSFDQRGWGQVKEITASVFASKGEPQLRVTHDSYQAGDEDASERTVLHVAWWEESGPDKEKRYASLVLEDGQFNDSDAVVDLTALLRGAAGGSPQRQDSPLDTLIQMQAGPHKDVVVMGFADPGLGRVVGLQVEVLPRALSRLSDRIKEELDSLTVVDRELARGAVTRAVDEVSGQFHPVALELIRQDLLSFLDQFVSEQFPDHLLPPKMGGRVIWIGAKIGRTGLESPGDPVLLEIPGFDDHSHHIAVTRLASWEIPEVGENPHLFFSRDGSQALVAWINAETTAAEYLESLPDGTWSEVQTLSLHDGMIDPVRAIDMLEKKALER